MNGITTICNGLRSNGSINTEIEGWRDILKHELGKPIMNCDYHNLIMFDDEIVFSMEEFIRQIENPLVSYFKSIKQPERAYDAINKIKEGIIDDLYKTACLRFFNAPWWEVA